MSDERDDGRSHRAEVEYELLRLRLQVEAREHQLAVARRTAEGAPHGRLRQVARAGRADMLEAARAGAARTRIPLAGMHAAHDGDTGKWIDEIAIDGVALSGLHADPPLAVTFRILPARGLRFRAFVGIRRGDRLGNRGGVRFSATVRDSAGMTAAHAERTVDPLARRGHRRWLPFELDLTGLGVDEHTLVLRTDVPQGANADYAWAAWGHPVLTLDREPLFSSVRAMVAAAGGLLGGRAVPAARDVGGRLSGAAPVISLLVPVHDPPPEFLQRTIASVLEQTAPNWQLCMADDGSRDPAVRAVLEDAASDPRVVLTRLDVAGGISAATNAALALATGEYVAPLDHDDTLEPGAVAAVGARLAADPGLDVLYTDNDKELPGGARFAPALKPGWSPEYLRACMYTLHLGVYRRALVERVGGWRGAFDGAQDHDLVLRLAAAGARVGHAAEVLYHWGVHPGSAAQGVYAKPEAYERGREAVEDHLRATGVPARAEALGIPGRFRVVHERDPELIADLIVPLPDGLSEDARAAVEALAADSREGVRVTVVTAQDVDPRERIAVVAGPAGTWGGLAAAGLTATSAAVVVLFEELVVPEGDGWLDELAGFVREEGVAAAGALVVDDVGRVVHAGVALPAGVPLPVHPGADPDAKDPAPELTMVTNRSAAAGVVAFDRAALQAAGGINSGLDRLALTAATLAVERVVVTPHARLRLVGAAPRGAAVAVRELLQYAGRRDPFYNPQLWADRANHAVPLRLQRAGFA